MIELPVAALEALEKIARATDEFTVMFKALSVGRSGVIVVPQIDMEAVQAGLLLHLVANLVESQTEIQQLKGQMAILRMDLKSLERKVDK